MEEVTPWPLDLRRTSPCIIPCFCKVDSSSREQIASMIIILKTTLPCTCEKRFLVYVEKSLRKGEGERVKCHICLAALRYSW